MLLLFVLFPFFLVSISFDVVSCMLIEVEVFFRRVSNPLMIRAHVNKIFTIETYIFATLTLPSNCINGLVLIMSKQMYRCSGLFVYDFTFFCHCMQLLRCLHCMSAKLGTLFHCPKSDLLGDSVLSGRCMRKWTSQNRSTKEFVKVSKLTLIILFFGQICSHIYASLCLK